MHYPKGSRRETADAASGSRRALSCSPHRSWRHPSIRGAAAPPPAGPLAGTPAPRRGSPVAFATCSCKCICSPPSPCPAPETPRRPWWNLCKTRLRYRCISRTYSRCQRRGGLWLTRRRRSQHSAGREGGCAGGRGSEREGMVNVLGSHHINLRKWCAIAFRIFFLLFLKTYYLH